MLLISFLLLLESLVSDDKTVRDDNDFLGNSFHSCSQVPSFLEELTVERNHEKKEDTNLLKPRTSSSMPGVNSGTLCRFKPVCVNQRELECYRKEARLLRFVPMIDSALSMNTSLIRFLNLGRSGNASSIAMETRRTFCTTTRKS